jgi:hypothetical protein
MTPNFELVRGNERLECDYLVWWDTTELAKAFGWKPRSPMRLSRDVSNPAEVADEDAQSLAMAIRECLRILTTNKRPTRRQMASLIRLAAAGGLEGNSVGLFVQQPARMSVFLKEPVRIAKFCCNGGFQMNLKTPDDSSA